jgi:tetratricopeptide (TPR) repeat protein
MVKAWREIVTIPTYEIGKAEKNPIFLEKRVYQGSSGVVYPYPVIESISDEKTDKEYKAVFIENEYIKVMILPELGGRIQMAYDKIKERHFVYYNHVIKPALVGLTGPWISGGIEFNWPQHHRPSTYLPVDSTIVENEDGSVTVWVNEMERMFHQKGMAGFTLRSGCAYLEIQGRVSNRTSLPQTFLWWANPAVEVNDAYQSVFPPDVNAVFDHGKRAVSSFPIATGTYYKMDYSAGVDISNYKNIYVPTSYMAVNSKYDFEGGYENDTKGGMLHVASHHFSPGKKQWTWGNGDFGRAWDRNLTDSIDNGKLKIDNCQLTSGFRPYIELMAGVYTENQPDFSWLMPYEEKQFVQYFMPYREIGIVKQASKDFVVGIETSPNLPCRGGTSPLLQEGSGEVTIKILATSKQTVRIVLDGEECEEYYNKVVTLSPEDVFVETVSIGQETLETLQLTIDRVEQSRRLPLLEWHAEPDEIRPIPDAAEAALSPQDTKTIDQLYLTGLHLEQYRHATWSALDYYEEALRRDPMDYRCNMQTGLWYLRRARFEKAEPYLQTAVKVLKRRNPNPYDGEPLFYLGLVKRFRHQWQEAYELFWKSTWNKAWADAGYYEAACISMDQERWEDALDELNRALISNSHNHQARALKAVVLRKLGLKDEALSWIQESYKIDPFNYVCMMEEHLLTASEEPLERMVSLMHGNIYNYHETALDYAHAGLTDEATQVLQTAIDHGVEKSPLTYYYLAYWNQLSESLDYFEQAAAVSPDYCFPNRLDDAEILGTFAQLPFVKDAHVPYYLGCLYYDKRQYDVAIENWELSAELDPTFPTVWRNLALARFNKQGRQEEALEYMEKAFHLDETDSRVLMELDQLYKRLHRPHQERLDFLQQYPELIKQRDDLVLEEITLLNQLGRYEEAKEKLDAHQFHPWEGGEGKVPAQYQICRVELAKKSLTPLLQEGMGEVTISQAIRLLQECLEYPHHLGEGKLYGAQENDFYYLLGVAYEALGQKEKARECWEEATKGPQEPAAAMYYNDAKPDKIFYQGLALQKLGREGEAHGRFYKLINYGKQHVFEKQVMDYFAVSLPDLLIWDDSLDVKNEIHCKYMLALGYYGMGELSKSQRYLEEVEALDNNHQGIQQFRSLVSAML